MRLRRSSAPPVAAGPGRECSGPTGHPPFSSDRACYLGQGDQATPEAYGPTGLLELHLNCKAPVLFAA